jgi:chromosome segregation ATPase
LAARLRTMQTRMRGVRDALASDLAGDGISSSVPAATSPPLSSYAASVLGSESDKAGAVRKVPCCYSKPLSLPAYSSVQILDSEADSMVMNVSNRVQALVDKMVADAEARRDLRAEAKLRDEVSLLRQQVSSLELQLQQSKEANRVLAAAKDDALREHEKVSGICARLHQLHDSTTALLKNSKKQYDDLQLKHQELLDQRVSDTGRLESELLAARNLAEELRRSLQQREADSRDTEQRARRLSEELRRTESEKEVIAAQLADNKTRLSTLLEQISSLSTNKLALFESLHEVNQTCNDLHVLLSRNSDTPSTSPVK